MYNFIINPNNNVKYSINSKKGLYILNNYLNIIGGGKGEIKQFKKITALRSKRILSSIKSLSIIKLIKFKRILLSEPIEKISELSLRQFKKLSLRQLIIHREQLLLFIKKHILSLSSIELIRAGIILKRILKEHPETTTQTPSHTRTRTRTRARKKSHTFSLSHTHTRRNPHTHARRARPTAAAIVRRRPRTAAVLVHDDSMRGDSGALVGDPQVLKQLLSIPYNLVQVEGHHLPQQNTSCVETAEDFYRKILELHGEYSLPITTETAEEETDSETYNLNVNGDRYLHLRNNKTYYLHLNISSRNIEDYNHQFIVILKGEFAYLIQSYETLYYRQILPFNRVTFLNDLKIMNAEKYWKYFISPCGMLWEKHQELLRTNKIEDTAGAAVAVAGRKARRPRPADQRRVAAPERRDEIEDFINKYLKKIQKIAEKINKTLSQRYRGWSIKFTEDDEDDFVEKHRRNKGLKDDEEIETELEELIGRKDDSTYAVGFFEKNTNTELEKLEKLRDWFRSYHRCDKLTLSCNSNIGNGEGKVGAEAEAEAGAEAEKAGAEEAGAEASAESNGDICSNFKDTLRYLIHLKLSEQPEDFKLILIEGVCI